VGAHGRVDLRALHAVSVDKTRGGLKDDAIGWCPLTHTVLVHSSSSLASAVSLGEPLDVLAARRGESAYLPGGNLMLLPPTLLACEKATALQNHAS
jgi:exoribonuclease R